MGKICTLIFLSAVSAFGQADFTILATEPRASSGGGDDLTGISIRYVADDIAGSDNDSVALWPDSGGSGYDMTQGGSEEPSLQTSEVNGHSAVLFNGADEMFSANVPGDDISGTTAQTVFVVLKQDSTQAQQRLLSWTDVTSLFYIHATFDDVIYYDNQNVVGGRISASQPGGWDDAWHLLEMVRDGANMNLLVDGSSLTSRSDASGNFSTSTGNLVLGSASDILYFKGFIAEVRIYNVAKDSTARTAIRAALKTTYGTP